MVDRVWITSIIIILISIFFSFRKSERFTSYKVFYLFSLFFFGIAPIVHYENKVSFFGARSLFEREYFSLNIIVIVIVLLFHFIYNYSRKKINQNDSFHLRKKNISDSYFMIVALLFLVNKVLLFREFSLMSFILRDSKNFLISNHHYFIYLINSLLYTLPIVITLQLLFYWKNKWNVLRIFTIILLILSSFPTALSRTSFGVLIVPMAFLIFPWLNRRNNFVLFFIVGFIYFFPFLNQFRNIRSFSELQFKPNIEIFKTAHFDSYYNFALIMYDIPIQWGKQLLGVLLFFIPRVWWETKPIGSGAYMAEVHNMSFTNISANYFAEGYINFGFIGIAFFLLILGFILSRLDCFGNISRKVNSPFFVLYLQLIFSVFYLLRGDLMSSFANITSIIFLNLIIIALLYRKHSNQ